MLPTTHRHERARPLRAILVLCSVLLLGGAEIQPGAHVTAATTYTVNMTTDTGTGVGTTGDLRYAITQVNAGGGGDTITITATGTILLGSALPALAKNVTITGPGANLLAVDGGCTFIGGRCTLGGVTVFQVTGGVSATISGLTIQHGKASVICGTFSSFPCGGGVFTQGMLKVTNCTFSGNGSEDLIGGGGIFNDTGGTLTVTNSAFSANSAYHGGGIFNNTSGMLTVTSSIFTGNIGSNQFAAGSSGGGAIYNGGMLAVDNSSFANNSIGNQEFSNSGGAIENAGTLIVTNSTFTSNTTKAGFQTHSGANGGAIATSGRATFINCTFTGNSMAGKGTGGAIFSSGTSTLTNLTISGNAVAEGVGGGIANIGTLTVTNSTIANNSATGTFGRTGGIYTNDFMSGTVMLTNTIVAGNTGSDLEGPISGNDNLIDDASGITGSGNIMGQPALLGTLGNYGGPTQTIPLLPGSPAIDSGAAIGQGPAGNPVPATDQRGFSRVGPPDIGAFEAQGFTLSCGGSTAPNLKVGQTILCTATGTGVPAGTAAPVQSSDPTIVAADGSGNITGERAGQVTIVVLPHTAMGTITVTVVVPTPIGISVPPAPSGRPSGTTSGNGAPSPAPAGRTSGASSAASGGATPNPLPSGR